MTETVAWMFALAFVILIIEFGMIFWIDCQITEVKQDLSRLQI